MEPSAALIQKVLVRSKKGQSIAVIANLEHVSRELVRSILDKTDTRVRAYSSQRLCDIEQMDELEIMIATNPATEEQESSSSNKILAIAHKIRDLNMSQDGLTYDGRNLD